MVTLPVALGLLIAVLTYGHRWGTWLRLPFLLPYAISGVAVGVIWGFVLQPDGALGQALGFFGLPGAHTGWLQAGPGNTIMMIVATDLAGGRGERAAVRGRAAVHPGRAAGGGPARRRGRLPVVRPPTLAAAAADHHGGRRAVDRRQPEDVRRGLGDDPGRPRHLVGDARTVDVQGDVRAERLRPGLGDRAVPQPGHLRGVGPLPALPADGGTSERFRTDGAGRPRADLAGAGVPADRQRAKPVDCYDAAAVWKPAGVLDVRQLRRRVGQGRARRHGGRRRRSTAWWRRCSRC